MKKVTLSILIFLVVAAPVSARNTKHMYSVREVMESVNGRAKLASGINFYFGAQKHPKIVKNYGEVRTNKKTNAFNKSDSEACAWVFLSSMIALQERALQEGANAIINIRSNYKNQEVSSETEFECGAGNIVAGVALKGELVKLAE